MIYDKWFVISNLRFIIYYIWIATDVWCLMTNH